MLRKIQLLFTAALLAISAPTSAQIPGGFNIQNGAVGSNRLAIDFDGDGKEDLFSVIEGNEQTFVFASLNHGALTLKSKEAPRCCNSVEVIKNTVVLHSNGNRGFYTWRFRYSPALKNFQLIGMDTESFGNAVQDYSGTSSLNLLTGAFEAKYNRWNERQQKLVPLPAVRKKLKITRRILLTDFGDESDDWVLGLTYKHLPKGAQ